MYEGLWKIKYHAKFRMTILFIIFLLIGAYFIPISTSERVNQDTQQLLMITEGQILYSPMWSTSTYLRESAGSLNHTWSSSYFPGVMTRWLGDGKILRTIRVGVGPGSGGAGGGVQIVQWDGTVVWDFRYNSNEHLSHHDVRSLPNGNVLLIAWETKTRTEAIAEGRNPNHISTQGFMPDHVIEVQPTGPTSGDIVWEWHVWDHLIQNYDSLKANFGIIGDHPELVNINYAIASESDWMHTNSIDYNENFDQILLSVHNFNEIWVIDHSTTTEEAAGHSGGNSGKGGDLLYRWGNPQAYDRGTASDQKLFLQHDASWIDDGCPGDGHILIFNNGGSRFYSTVDEIVPPVDANGDYYLAPVSTFGPTVQIWTYNPQPSFYASIISGAQRLPSGNTLICNGETGEIFEVTPTGSTIWEFDIGEQVFNVEYISPEDWSCTPQSGQNLKPDDGSLTGQVPMIAPDEEDSDFEEFIRVENSEKTSDYELIPVSVLTPTNTNEYTPRPSLIQQFILKLQQWYLLFEKILKLPLLH